MFFHYTLTYKFRYSQNNDYNVNKMWMKCEYWPSSFLLYDKKQTMLSKKHRIDKRLFKKAFDKGTSFHSEIISLKIIPLPGKSMCFAFVVPAKAAKKAVDRNKIKRKARHIVKKNQQLFKKNFAAIFFFKKGSEKMKFLELEQRMLQLSKKAGII